ncbi:MAG: hypothetical protein HKN04_10095 [Rhodothermaceae bacterium]|nr:hypothetical protein [Rhodothermaceae bacterium]
MPRFRILTMLFILALALVGCNTGYVTGPEEQAAQQEPPAEAVQPSTLAEAE